MKTIILSLIIAIAASSAFAQSNESKYSLAGGVDSGLFGTFGIRLSQNTSTYTNARFSTGFGTSLSQGLSYKMLQVNQFSMAVGADAGFTSRSKFAVTAGVMPAFDVSKWTKIPGLSIVGRVQMQRIGTSYSPNIGVGLSKSF